MQVIRPTYNRYKHPQYDKGLTDPLSNMLASIRYSLSRYKSLSRAWRGVGYANGGIIKREHLALLGEGNREEVVVPLEQNQTHAERLISYASTRLNLFAGIEHVLEDIVRGGQKHAEMDYQIGIGTIGNLAQINSTLARGDSGFSLNSLSNPDGITRAMRVVAEAGKRVIDPTENLSANRAMDYLERIYRIMATQSQLLMQLLEKNVAVSPAPIVLDGRQISELTWRYDFENQNRANYRARRFGGDSLT